MPPDDDARRTALAKRLSLAGVAVTVVGLVVVYFLRSRGIRYVGPVPTLVFVWLPFSLMSAAQNWVLRVEKRRWVSWIISFVIFVGLTIYLSSSR